MRKSIQSGGTRFDLQPIKPMNFAYNDTEFTNSELNNAERELREVHSQPADKNSGKRTFGRRGIKGIPTVPAYPF